MGAAVYLQGIATCDGVTDQHWILNSHTACMKRKPAEPNRADLRQKTQFSNLIRYTPSGTYFARLRVNGKLIRKTLKTDVLSVAKLRLADLSQKPLSAQPIQIASQDQPFVSQGMQIQHAARLLREP